MIKQGWIVLGVITTLLLAGCGSDESTPPVKQERNTSLTFEQWEPGVRLHPYQSLKPGSSVQQIQELFPDIGSPQAEGGSTTLKQRGLTELATQVTFDNKTVEAEFNFRNDTLYSYYFTILESSWSRADRDRWHDMLVKEWNRAFGDVQPEEQQEGAYQASTHFWHQDSFDAVVTKSQTGKALPIISWGIQEPRK
jgi:hypothetical protein